MDQQAQKKSHWFLLILAMVSLLAVPFLEAAWEITSEDINPKENPIKCNNDSSISRPLIDDLGSIAHRNYLRRPNVFFALDLFLILIMAVTETVIHCSFSEIKEKEDDDDMTLLQGLITFWFVSLATQLLTGLTADLTGKAMGVLAPNFLALCRPDAELFESLCANGTQYAHVNCTSSHPSLVKAARQACPSVSVTAMTCLMTTVFLWASHRVNKWPLRNKLVKLCIRSSIQLVTITITLTVALDTYFRNEGDWIDISAGFIWGAFLPWFILDVLLIGHLGWKEDHQVPQIGDGTISTV